MTDTCSVSFCVVNNIPKHYHAADLRNFFSQFLETGGFDCFHFRHRPEIQVRKTTKFQNVKLSDTNVSKSNATTCCVVRVPTLKVEQFIKMYAKKHWLNQEGETLASRCFISKIKVTDASGNGIQQDCYKTRVEQREIPDTRIQFTKSDLEKLAEMHPPPIMPNGNVGTQTLVFLELIKSCRLPPKIIRKLKLEFPKSRGKRKYGSVPFDYGTGQVTDCGGENYEQVLSANGREISSVYIPQRRPKKLIPEKVEDADVNEQRIESDEDDDTGEEWDRHESLHNDITQQERVKERLYEEEIELQWEKGGSGLTFYTDAQYWDALEGDFDEKTADDWDIDTSIYYEKGSGDKDARDFVQMRREQRLRNGEEDDDTFCKKPNTKIGAFEKHTKGIGRKIMEKRGWKDGNGLGSTIIGMASALGNEGQLPSNKTGFGYHGQKLNRYLPESVLRKKKRQCAEREVLIATVFDKRCDIEPKEPLLRSNLPTATKYRTTPYFIRSKEVLNA